MSGYIGNIPTPQATQTRDVFTATAGQTSFATSGYTPGFLDVYLNGVKLIDGTDFTASNGSDVVLVTGATLNDTLEVLSYSTFEVNSQNFTGNTVIDNVDINDGTIDGTVIGGSSPAAVTGTAGSFSNLSVNGNPIATAGSLSNRNKIINGNFDIWQRGTSGSSGYVADRWQTPLSGSTAAITQQEFTLGQTDVPNEPKFFHRTVVTSIAGSSNYVINVQRIEGVRMLAGQTATLSFWAKADATKNIAVEFTQVFGSGGSPSATVTSIGVTTIALTTAWQKFTVTVSVPSISGKTLGTDNNDQLILHFWLDAGIDWNSRTNSLGQQSGTFDIAQVQLEAGDTATPFEHRSIGQELALCQRYFQQFNAPRMRGVSSNVALNRVGMPLLVEMRAVPTALTSGTHDWYDGSTSGTATTATSGYATPTSIEFDFLAATGTIVGNRPVVFYVGAGGGIVTASAEL